MTEPPMDYCEDEADQPAWAQLRHDGLAHYYIEACGECKKRFLGNGQCHRTFVAAGQHSTDTLYSAYPHVRLNRSIHDKRGYVSAPA